MAESITDYIRRDLRARLQTNGGPVDLTLTALAEEYQVSLTPVRLAVRDLMTEQLLTKLPNGRLIVNRDRTQRLRAAPDLPPSPPPDLNKLEAALTSELIRMSLRGETEYLREEVTAERLGVGRAVLRQLFNRLQGKGLIEHLPRRGWRVRPFDEADMLAYLEIRTTLESKALDLAKPHLVRADLEAMLRGNLPTGPQETVRLDNHLHQYLVEKSGNPYIRDFFDRHGLYFTTLFDYAAPEARVVAGMARQHRAILRALISRDWPRARKELARHIHSQRPIVRRLLQRIGQERTLP